MNQDLQNGAGAPNNPTTLKTPVCRRVLVVDDDPDAAEALAELLSMNGHDVHVATASDQALMLFQSLQPQVAVLDIGLPVMDGYELRARMHQLPGGADCVFVALTGYGMKSEQEHSRQAGFRAHLVKPVNLEQLAALIEGSAGSASSGGSAGSGGSGARGGARRQ